MSRITGVLGRAWPYFVFGALVLLYNYRYLGMGYCPSMDEGYLQSLGARVLSGELPYRDFYFFRTPLSVYIQAGLIALLGDSYTIMAGRIYCVVQTTLTAVLASFVYRKLVSGLELLLLLVASYVVTTLMLDFPWYSYDALFFAVLALLFFHRRLFVLSGAMVAFAALCKQSYVMLLPLGIVIGLLGPVVSSRLRLGRLSDLARVTAGFGVCTSVFGVYLILTSGIGSFIANIFTLPAECAHVSLEFAIFQNAGKALIVALPAIAAILTAFYANRVHWILYVGTVIAVPLMLTRLASDVFGFSFSLVFINYAVALPVLIAETGAGLFESFRSRLKGIGGAYAIALIIQYLSGVNYSGLAFAHMGAGIALPFSYIALRRFAGSLPAKAFALLLITAILGIGLYQKTTHVYFEAKLPALTEEFSHPKLAGVSSTPTNVEIFQSILETVEQNSDSTDFIFVFPKHPSIYFLSERRNPTPVQWYYKLEYNDDIFEETMLVLREVRPKLVLIDQGSAPPALGSFIDTNYVLLAQHWRLQIYGVTGQQ